jgi:hypothetical protein
VLLQRMHVAITCEGEHVQLVIGSSRWALHYETALALSGLLRLEGQAAKRAAGDFGRRWSAMGTLHDANRGPDAGQPHTPGKVYPVNRDVLPRSSVAARRQGTTVVLKLGSAEAAMPYQAALTIAQWLRLRAKEGKRRAGDMARHWSTVAQEAHGA